MSTRARVWGALVLLLTGLLAGVVAWRRAQPPAGPSAEDVERLRARRTALQDRFRELTTGRDDEGLSQAPAADVILGLPTSLTRSLVEQVTTGLFREVRLELRKLQVRTSDDVQGKVLFKRRTLGSFVLEVDIERVSALLEPGNPQLDFSGDRIRVRQPVALARGEGRAQVRFRWDGKGIAGAVCGDLDVTLPVSGRVKPRDYAVGGAFELATDGGFVVARPRFGPVRVHLEIEPAAATWQAVDALIDQQGLVCRTALRKADVAGKVRALVARGFDVTLPRTLLREVRLPAGLTSSVAVPGRTLELEVEPIGLALTPTRTWYGADVAPRARLDRP